MRIHLCIAVVGVLLACSSDGRDNPPDPTPDSGAPFVDGGGTDAGTLLDAGQGDAGDPVIDAGAIDGGPGDAGVIDGGPGDAGVIDGGLGDAGVIDGGSSDAGPLFDAPCGHEGETCCSSSVCEGSLACRSGLCLTAAVADTGRSCTKNADCLSGICVSVAVGRKACTTGCTNDDSCVRGWSCRAPTAGAATVCQCTSQSELCDGADNDCNGRVDDGPRPNALCSATEPRTCQDGACTCTAEMCGSECVRLSDDPNHCGACDHSCAGGEKCRGGQCVCDEGKGICGGACVSLASSSSNCGACGITCNPGSSCQGGQCRCGTGLQSCSTGCFNLLTSTANCGACGRACPTGTQCVSGQCICGSATDTACGTECVDLHWSRANCGACGQACGGVCSYGRCVCGEEDQAFCGNACFDTQTDPNNCGGCGQVCGAGTVCRRGACECPDGWGVCNGSCIDLTSDAANCTTCGHLCPSIGGASGACIAGQCGSRRGLASRTDWVTSLLVDETNLYWTESNRVMRRPLVGGATSTVATGDVGGALFLSGSDLIIASYSGWFSISKYSSNGTPATLVKIDSPTGAGVVDAGNLYYFWLDSLVRLSLSNRQSTTLATGQDRAYPLIKAGTQLYWARTDHLGARASIVRMPVAGGTPVTLGAWPLHQNEWVTGLAVDATAAWYLLQSSPSRLVKVPLGGGTPTTLLVGRNPGGLIVDNGLLYWSEEEGIRRMSTAGGPIATVAPGWTSGFTIDATSLYWAADGVLSMETPR